LVTNWKSVRLNMRQPNWFNSVSSSLRKTHKDDATFVLVGHYILPDIEPDSLVSQSSNARFAWPVRDKSFPLCNARTASNESSHAPRCGMPRIPAQTKKDHWAPLRTKYEKRPHRFAWVAPRYPIHSSRTQQMKYS